MIPCAEPANRRVEPAQLQAYDARRSKASIVERNIAKAVRQLERGVDRTIDQLEPRRARADVQHLEEELRVRDLGRHRTNAAAHRREVDRIRSRLRIRLREPGDWSC